MSNTQLSLVWKPLLDSVRWTGAYCSGTRPWLHVQTGGDAATHALPHATCLATSRRQATPCSKLGNTTEPYFWYSGMGRIFMVTSVTTPRVPVEKSQPEILSGTKREKEVPTIYMTWTPPPSAFFLHRNLKLFYWALVQIPQGPWGDLWLRFHPVYLVFYHTPGDNQDLST